MSVSSFLLGYRRFWSEKEIISFIGKSKHFNREKEDPNNADALLIFETSRQQTWIAATKQRLYCILDDITKNEPHINWSMEKSEIIKENKLALEIDTRDKSAKTGLVDIGHTHRNWLFTKRLFQTTNISNNITRLITKIMV